VRILGVVVGTVLALAVQTTLSRYITSGVLAVDLVLVVVVYVALTSGPESGLLTGAFAGLVQDALSTTGLIGVGGLAKTLIGFLTGIIGTQFIVAQPLPRFVVFFAASIVHSIVFTGLYLILDPRRFGTPYLALAGQALGNAVVGLVTFQLVERLPGAVERRKAARGRLRR
jgi:rod shape-determining protein MreD